MPRVLDGKIPYRPGALAVRKRNFANRATADPQTRCFQPGVPHAAYLPTPFQIFQNARAVYLVFSRGHWEGRTLVADVASFSDSTWLDGAGNYHSDALHVVERYTRPSERLNS